MAKGAWMERIERHQRSKKRRGRTEREMEGEIQRKKKSTAKSRDTSWRKSQRRFPEEMSATRNNPVEGKKKTRTSVLVVPDAANITETCGNKKNTVEKRETKRNQESLRSRKTADIVFQRVVVVQNRTPVILERPWKRNSNATLP